MNANGVKLVGGPNIVDDKTWQEASNHPTIKALVAAGTIEFKLGIKPDDFINSMSPRQAIDTVKETIDNGILARWKAKEKRPIVMKEINEQLKKLAAPAELRDRARTGDKIGEKSPDELPPDFTGDEE
jgi:hypothetical protein